MFALYDDYLIKDIKALHYTYDPEEDCWRAQHYRGNNVRNLGTRIKLRITKKSKIKATLKAYEASPRCHNIEDYHMTDKKKIKFEDNNFLKKLKSLKTDQ